MPCNYVRDAHLRYAEQGYRVVSWDQLGCGESDQPDDDSLWTVERYVEEMETVRSALGLGRVAVVGNSWGGMLGLEYCLAHPENVKCFVSSSIAYDFREVQQGFVRCKQNLGDETVLMMARRESEGTTEHPEYQAAQKILLYRHMCRMETWPEPVQQSLDNVGFGPLQRMFGPHLFNCTGTLRWYDRVGDLHRVTTPCWSWPASTTISCRSSARSRASTCRTRSTRSSPAAPTCRSGRTRRATTAPSAPSSKSTGSEPASPSVSQDQSDRNLSLIDLNLSA